MVEEYIRQYVSGGVRFEFCGDAATFEVPVSEIREVVAKLYSDKKLSLKLITATDERVENGSFKIWYVFGVPKDNVFIVPFVRLINTTDFPSVSSVVSEGVNYERKIASFFGLLPVGCPDARPIILHENWPANVYPLRKDFNAAAKPAMANGSYDFQRVDGEGIYEIPVGPIHAGIIEPGHFRFSVAGERIVLLEPKLGFTHKGSEKLFEVLPLPEKIKLSEKISGDSSFSHSLAFCQALEKLSDTKVPVRARYLRVIYAELERLANHFGDAGAVMIDTGFNFGGTQGARLREIVMRMNERLTGSRFLRGANMIGGVAKDIGDVEKDKISSELENLKRDFSEVIAVAENSTSLLNRLKGTGVLSADIAKRHGVTGIAGKAAGLEKDTRVDYPYAAYDGILPGGVAVETDGDAFARFTIRVKEAHAAIKIIQDALLNLPAGDTGRTQANISFKKNAVAVSLVEGWRGEIAWFVATDAQGNISRVAPRDPSFINWSVLPDAAYDNVIPDFPLINKSFNLSYSGNDL